VNTASAPAWTFFWANAAVVVVLRLLFGEEADLQESDGRNAKEARTDDTTTTA